MDHSFPFELSRLAATKPEVLRALARIHGEELSRHDKHAAKARGETGKLHAGAVTFVQRFGSSLNLHVRLHTCALDGVYVEGAGDDDVRFVPAEPPTRAELYVLAERVALRGTTWLRKRGHAAGAAPAHLVTAWVLPVGSTSTRRPQRRPGCRRRRPRSPRSRAHHRSRVPAPWKGSSSWGGRILTPRPANSRRNRS